MLRLRPGKPDAFDARKFALTKTSRPHVPVELLSSNRIDCATDGQLLLGWAMAGRG